MSDSVVRIGSASGFWGDTASAAPALVASGDIGYLVFEYLAEVKMSILAAQKAKDPNAGYATDFVHITMKALLPELRRKGIKVVANAGGVNPIACRDALARIAADLQLPLRIGVVLGDDLSARAGELRERGISEMFSGTPFPQRTASINAYLGAMPIARALDAGCDVGVTGPAKGRPPQERHAVRVGEIEHLTLRPGHAPAGEQPRQVPSQRVATRDLAARIRVAVTDIRGVAVEHALDVLRVPGVEESIDQSVAPFGVHSRSSVSVGTPSRPMMLGLSSPANSANCVLPGQASVCSCTRDPCDTGPLSQASS